MNKTIGIVALGEPLYELNQQADGRYLGGFGGDTSNVVIAARRLGANTAYVSRIGGDIFGDALRGLWDQEGVDATAVKIDKDTPTGLYFVTHHPEGHRFTYRRKGSAASLMSVADVPDALIASAKILHVSGISQAISPSAAHAVDHAIAVAEAAGTLISFDTNFRPALWDAETARPAIERAAVHAAILKTSIDDSRALFGDGDPHAIAARFLKLGAKEVLVTLGPDGVLVADGARAQILKGHRVAAVDATGAGDAFTGALLAEVCRGSSIAEAVPFANAAAALSTLGYGAIAPLPKRADVERFLNSAAH
ncbi:sugar kinase [Aestuariivirga sp.]|uniref:sugar kinase n=1 Tax=Aestuariivirga sp. TaxID=2650926 RepID=UPI0039E60515